LSEKVPITISKEIVYEDQRRVDESGGEPKSVGGCIELVLTELLKEEKKIEGSGR